MRLLLLVLLLICVARVRGDMAIVLDVSGSMVENRAYVRQQVEQYLFSRYNQRNHVRVELWAFATEAWQLATRLFDIGVAEDRAAVLQLIETIHFQTHWPNYYTNWEAALQALVGRSHIEHVYLITDGNPTMSQEPACLRDPPCDNEALNVQRAAAVAHQLIGAAEGKHVIPIGVGDGVDDERLAAIAGPCTWSRCYRNWDYYHIDGPTELRSVLTHAYEARAPAAAAEVAFDHYARYQSPRVVVNADGRVLAMTPSAPRWLQRPSLRVGDALGEAVFDAQQEDEQWVRTPIRSLDWVVAYEVMPRYHQHRQVSACLNDLYGSPVACAGNDVQVVTIFVESPGPINCTDGETLNVMACYNVTFTVTVTANNRYDVGITFANDGGDALSGDCTTHGLLPVTDNETLMDFTGGYGPYRDIDGDACGDMNKFDPPVQVIVQNISLACVDEDDDGIVDLTVCSLWKNMADGGDCTSEADLRPGTVDKCNCDRLPFDDVLFIPLPTTTTTTTTTEEPTTTAAPTTTTTTTTTAAPTTTTTTTTTTTAAPATTTSEGVDRDAALSKLSASVIALSVALGILGVAMLCLLVVWCASRTAYGHYHYYRDDASGTIVERWHEAKRHEAPRGILQFETAGEAESTALQRHVSLPRRQTFRFKQ